MELRRSKRINNDELVSPKRTKTVLGSNKQSINMLTPPSTPSKVRVMEMDNQKPVKKVNLLNTPPATPTKSPARLSRTNVYSKAKALFQRGYNGDSDNSTLIGRVNEGSELNKFLSDNITNNTCNSLYISGPPGTGKTAQVNLSFAKLDQKNTKVLKINCMTMTKPEHIFHEIYCGITNTHSADYHKRKTFDDLSHLLTDKQSYKSVVILLDEMDYLITKDQQILFQLFNCASTRKSHLFKTKLVLIGISNALDLTDKFLPRLKSNGLNPQSLVFLPYTSDQIKQVIISKLKSLIEDKENMADSSFIPIIHPVAIQLCCKKAASVTGDLRKSFDICYKGIEMVENSIKTKNDVNLNELTFYNAPKVTISNIASICTSSFGAGSMTKLNNLNLFQKAVLSTLMNLQARQVSPSPFNRKDFNVNSFYDFYLKHMEKAVGNLLGICKKGEFLEIISTLEANSVIVLSNTGSNIELGNRIIKSNVPWDDIEKSIGEIGVLKKLLHYKY